MPVVLTLLLGHVHGRNVGGGVRLLVCTPGFVSIVMLYNVIHVFLSPVKPVGGVLNVDAG